jgi:hypothetical protein
MGDYDFMPRMRVIYAVLVFALVGGAAIVGGLIWVATHLHIGWR